MFYKRTITFREVQSDVKLFEEPQVVSDRYSI